MSKFIFLAFLVFLFAPGISLLLKNRNPSPRDLLPLQTKPLKQERQLLGGPSKQEELEEEAHRKRKMQQMQLVMGNLARDDEMRNLEATMNDIGNNVEEINETINAKLAEFTDMIERLKSQKMVNKKIMRLPRG